MQNIGKRILLFICMLIVFFVSAALTVPPIPSEADEAIDTSVIDLGLPIDILLTVIYAQLFIKVFTCSKIKKMIIYWFGVSIGIVLIRSLGWYLGELSFHGYMFYDSLLISIFYIVISYVIFHVLLMINK